MVQVEGLEKVSCNSCGANVNLVYHHTSYDPEVVEVVCRSCHGQIHNPSAKKRVRPNGFKSKIIKPSEPLSPLISIDQQDKEEIDALSRVLAEKLNVKGVSYAVAVHELVEYYKQNHEVKS